LRGSTPGFIQGSVESDLHAQRTDAERQKETRDPFWL